MGQVVLATYKVKVSNQPKFFQLLKEKRNYFIKKGYITKRPPILLRSKKNKQILLEIFEWINEKSSKTSHKDSVVRKFWKDMEDVWIDAGFSLDKIPESQKPFSHLEPIDIYD